MGILSFRNKQQDMEGESSAPVNNDCPVGKTMDESFSNMKQQTMKLLGKYSQTFTDSEGVDGFYEARIDELIKEAKEVEQSLLSQIENFQTKLRGITETLKSVPISSNPNPRL